MKDILIGILYTISIIACLPNQKQVNKTLWTVAWSPSGEYIATGGNQDNLKIYEAKTFKLIKTYPVRGVTISRIKWHPTKNILAIVTQSKTVKARMLDFEKDTWIDLQGLESGFRGLDWNYKGDMLAVSELERNVSIFNLEGKRISRFMADPKGVAGLDWHPFKNILTTVGAQIGIYNYLGDIIKVFEPRAKETFLLSVEWHKSGNFFAVGDYGDLEKADNKLVQFWNIEGEKLNEISGSLGEYRNIRWNGAGSTLATASDALRIWTKKGELLAESKSSEDYLWGIDWSPDGKFIITSSSKGKIVIWDSNANKIKELDY
ncbi:WD40 repeat domain-containing protein [Flavivirga spongiicola]|uniref:Anaphase-promoting complex subunit 4-like WD40 domain-containing protein n=1 Tax=Flavivirga spongiicola TaxID=421621 RepID=A0ABU7XSL1_9FLAO|nr:hypothetical protein [Flavivirga sp. MEBiC05379]MDO5978718.1 hypothetical protein [Flavivirga sp. MEBiC05379]